MNLSLPALAKVSRPILPNVFPRRRLFDLLDDLRKRPAIWVTGSPGCGKTTLIGSYVQSFNIHCLWYNLDEGDSDPASFFYYLGLAAKKAIPRMRKSLPLLTPEYLSGISTFTRRYFENLCSRLKNPSIMVFDNYQDVPGDAAFHDLMRAGLSIISEGINVILISRSEPPARLVRQKANRMMQTIGWEQLRFTLEETQELLQLNNQKSPSKKTIKELYRITDGWVAGLVLMLETAREQAFELRQIDDMTREDIFNYFASELFDKTVESTREFLLKTAFLPEMTGNMAQALSRHHQVHALLNGLERKNYFVTRHVHQKIFYRFHPLFRAFLMAKARETMTDDALANLLQATAEILMQTGKIDAAAELLLEAKRWDAISHIILQHGQTLLEQGRFQMLDTWLSHLPLELVENSPWLLLYQGFCRQAVDPLQAQKLSEKAYQGFKDQGDGMGQLMAWAAVVDSIALIMGDLTVMDDWIAEFENIKAGYENLPIKAIKTKVAGAMVAALTFRQPRHPDILDWVDRAILLADELGVVNEQVKARFQLVWYHIAVAGEYTKAEGFVDEMLVLTRKPEASPMAQIMACMIACNLYGYSAQTQKALAVGRRGLELSHKTGLTFMDNAIRANIAQCHLDSGNIPAAAEQFQQIKEKSVHFRLWSKFLHDSTMTRYLMIKGDLRRAEVLIDKILELKATMDLWHSNIVADLWKAQLLCLQGKYPQAWSYNQSALKTAGDIQSLHPFSCALLIKAHIALEQGDEESGYCSLQEALVISRQKDFLFTYFDLPEITASLCAIAIEAGIEADRAREVILRRRLVPEKSPIHLEDWPWELKIYALGRFGLVRKGKPVRFTRKAQEKPLTLLKALIAFGGREVSEEQIADALWPDTDGDLAHKSLATTLWRLRKLIGCPDAIQLSDKKLTLDPRYCWVDVWAFERIIRQAESAWKQGTEEKDMGYAISLVQKALEFYQGPFLAAEINTYWTISLRERLQSRFLRAVKRLCEYWEQTGQVEKAVECYQRSLEVDDLAEDLYQDLMTCFWQLGRQADALSVYERYKETLFTKLGADPSPETETMRDALITKSKPRK